MAINTTLRRNWREVVARCWNWGYFGERPEGIAPDIACLNGESILTLAWTSTQPTPIAAPTGTIKLIGTDGTSANNVVLPAGTTVNGTIIPTAEHVSFLLDAATAISRSCYITPTTLQLTGVQAVFGTASASGTVTVEHLTGTQAPGGGTALLTAALSTAGTANTVLTGTLIATLASLQFAAGDRLGLVFGGTETGLAGLAISATFKRI